MIRLHEVADNLGFTIEAAPLVARDGECRVDLKRIRLRCGMTERLERWTLGHELGHAVHGHQLNILGQADPRQERAADEWAALFLIDLNEYREVELTRGGHLPSMAHDLGIVTRGVAVYRGILARIGDDVYLKPRHGAGQWGARVSAA